MNRQLIEEYWCMIIDKLIAKVFKSNRLNMLDVRQVVQVLCRVGVQQDWADLLICWKFSRWLMLRDQVAVIVFKLTCSKEIWILDQGVISKAFREIALIFWACFGLAKGCFSFRMCTNYVILSVFEWSLVSLINRRKRIWIWFYRIRFLFIVRSNQVSELNVPNVRIFTILKSLIS